MTAHMLTAVHIPIEESYAWPKLTMATFASYLGLLQRKESEFNLHRNTKSPFSVQSFLVDMFSDEILCTSPYARNRLLGLRIQLGLAVGAGKLKLTPLMDKREMIDSSTVQKRQKISAGASGSEESNDIAKSRRRKERRLFSLLFHNTRVAGSKEMRDEAKSLDQAWFRTTQVKMTLNDPTAPRGGVFEPALAAVLVKDGATVKGMMKRSGSWVKETYNEAAEPLNLLHEWIGKRSGASLQFIQTFTFDPRRIP